MDLETRWAATGYRLLQAPRKVAIETPQQTAPGNPDDKTQLYLPTLVLQPPTSNPNPWYHPHRHSPPHPIVFSVGNSSSQPYPASGLAIVVPTFVLRSCYYSLMKPIQSFVSHYSTGYEYPIMLPLLLSLLHVAVVIYNSSVMKKKVYL